MDGKDDYSSVWVTAKDGVSQDELLSQVEPLVPEGFKGWTGEGLAEENQNDVQQALGFITTFLLVFAGIALFVGSFLIINTFSSEPCGKIHPRFWKITGHDHSV